ncbi:MAG: nitrilase-related carbon-nitrogen hydrolase [bacterium]
MLVGVVQTKPEFGSVRTNINNAIELMNSARADLYVLPELFNTGYNFIDEAEAATLSEEVTGLTYQALCTFAAKNSCCIVYGFAEREQHRYNSSALVGPEGIIGLYRKVHLFDREKLFFAPGNLGFPVFTLPFGTLGMMICYDWIYPEAARTLMLKGAQIIAHPANLVLPFCPDAMITRCLENRVFAITADRVGKEERGGVYLQFIGKSEIVSPRGEILCRLGTDDSGIAITEIDIALATNKQVTQRNNLLEDRFKEYYLM